jgi:cysteine desulfurase
VPLIHGGGHQAGLRSGTFNVPGIVGLGKAAYLAKQEMEFNANKTKLIRDKMERCFLENGQAKINGKINQRLPTISNIELIKEDADEFIVKNKSIYAISRGSACNSELIEESHVIKAMFGSSTKQSIRFSFSHNSNTNL